MEMDVPGMAVGGADDRLVTAAGRAAAADTTPGAAQSSLGGRTATRALVALGTYVAQDLRDAEGLTRPLLRRAALRLALNRRESARRLGGAYLRLDPLAADEGRRSRGRDRGCGIRVSAAGASVVGRRAVPRSRRRARRRVEADPHPVYHEHMLRTLKDEHAAPAD